MKRATLRGQVVGSMLGRKQESAIGSLLIHRTVEDAARAVGVSSKTIQRWLKRSDFQAAYQQARREALSQCMARLQQASAAAVSTLLKVMLDPTSPPGSRVRAADCVLTHATQGVSPWDAGSQNPAKSAVFDPRWFEGAVEKATESVRLLREAQEAGIIGQAQTDKGTPVQ